MTYKEFRESRCPLCDEFEAHLTAQIAVLQEELVAARDRIEAFAADEAERKVRAYDYLATALRHLDGSSAYTPSASVVLAEIRGILAVPSYTRCVFSDFPCNFHGTVHRVCDYTGLVTPLTRILK